MNEIPLNPHQPQPQPITAQKVEEQKNMARFLYAVHGLTFAFSLGLFSIVPLIFNYMKRPESEGTFVFSHHTWMIRSFWWYVVWVTIGWVFVLTVFGFPVAIMIWGAVWIWKVYRLIRGFLDLNNDKTMPV